MDKGILVGVFYTVNVTLFQTNTYISVKTDFFSPQLIAKHTGNKQITETVEINLIAAVAETVDMFSAVKAKHKGILLAEKSVKIRIHTIAAGIFASFANQRLRQRASIGEVIVVMSVR